MTTTDKAQLLYLLSLWCKLNSISPGTWAWVMHLMSEVARSLIDDLNHATKSVNGDDLPF